MSERLRLWQRMGAAQGAPSLSQRRHRASCSSTALRMMAPPNFLQIESTVIGASCPLTRQESLVVATKVCVHKACEL